MIRRLRWKMTAITTLLSALLLGAVCAAFLLSLGDSLRRDSFLVLERVIAETETPQWSGEDAAVALPYFTVTVTPNGGTSVTSSQFYDLSDYGPIRSAVDAALSQGRPWGELTDVGLRYLRQATEAGWRMAFVDVSYERSTLRKAGLTVAAVAVLGTGILFGLSVLLARWAVGPVETAMEQQRQFVADASHELKTPLTVILSNADLIAREPDLSSEVRRWTEHIRSGGSRMQALVEELLTLERSGRSAAPAGPVDLSELVQSALLAFEPVAYEAGRVLREPSIEGDLMVEGRGEELCRLVEILLDNAVKYARPGGAVTVTLEAGRRRALLRVADQGTPIPREELERIFRRFYRSDTARTSGGFGLGLAIARSIAQSHGGRLWAESDGSGWNTFCCELPLAN